MAEIDVSTLKADLLHCSVSAARYEEIVVGGKDAGQADIRYAKDLAKYYRDAAEKVRNAYLAIVNEQLANKITIVEPQLPSLKEVDAAFGVGTCTETTCEPKKVVTKPVEKKEVEEETFGDVFNELPQNEG